jgi:hypothetical protein
MVKTSRRFLPLGAPLLLMLLSVAACGDTNGSVDPGPPSGSSGSVNTDGGSSGSSGAGGSDAGDAGTNPATGGGCTSLSGGSKRYVRAGASGNGSGTDWLNAMPALPAVLVRGDTYYLADGTYGRYTFNTPNSGSTQIAIKKATENDHGTATGWQATYGQGQADFSAWQVLTDNHIFDGQRRNSDWTTGATSQYGIKIAGDGPLRISSDTTVGADNATFCYVDVQAGGRDTGSGDDVVYGLSGNSNITFQSCALHDSDRTIFTMRGNWKNLVVDHTYMARNTSTPASHGELLSMTESENVTWSHNVMEDIEGTGFIVGINDGIATNWNIFGNVFYHSPAYHADTGRKPGHNEGVSGVVFVADDASNRNIGNNFRFYNNTIVGIVGLWSGVIIQKGTGNEVRNNLWFDSVRTNNSFDGAISNNWYYKIHSGRRQYTNQDGLRDEL